MKSHHDKKYDLEERTFVFTINVIDYFRNLPIEITYSEMVSKWSDPCLFPISGIW